MKKIFTTIAAILIFAGSAFALNFSADGNFTIPMNAWYDKYNFDAFGIQYTMTRNNLDYGFGFDVGGEMMVTNQFGARVAFGLSWPQGVNYSTKEFNTVTNKTTTGSGSTSYNTENTSLMAINLFAGPVITVKKDRNYMIDVNPGFYMQTRIKTVKNSDDSTTTSSSSDFGLGAEIDARYNLTKKCFVRASCPIIWTFSSKDNSSGESHDVQKLSFAPHFGIGYKF